MANNKLGVIGGSGLYDVEEFKDRKLIEISGGKVACFVFVINLFDLNGSDNLIKKGYKVENLIEFPGH